MTRVPSSSSKAQLRTRCEAALPRRYLALGHERDRGGCSQLCRISIRGLLIPSSRVAVANRELSLTSGFRQYTTVPREERLAGELLGILRSAEGSHFEGGNDFAEWPDDASRRRSHRAQPPFASRCTVSLSHIS